MQKTAELDRVLQDLADKGLTFGLLINFSRDDCKQARIKAAVARHPKKGRKKRKHEGNEEEIEAANTPD